MRLLSLSINIFNRIRFFFPFQGYQIAAIWGRTLPSADAAANALSIPYATNRIDDVLLRHDVSLVVVLCEPAMHATVAARALGIGKHVCVQSPGGLTQEEAARMVQVGRHERGKH